MNAIDIRSLTKIYRGKKGAKVKALDNLALQVAPGEVLGFLGPNGAGKSTTIKILTGQVRPSDGAAFLYDVPVVKAAARKRVGYLPENPALYEYLTAKEYLRYVGKIYSLDRRVVESKIQELLLRLELADAENRKIRGYSKGMVQRLGLAQALLPDPDLFILDEPMSGLDPLGRAMVKEIIRDLKQQGKTVFFSTHITSDVEELCDRLAIIVKGKLRVNERVDTLISAGISGYTIFADSRDGLREEIKIPVAELQQGIERATSNGYSVERIEPTRKSLEKIFLETVADATAQTE